MTYTTEQALEYFEKDMEDGKCDENCPLCNAIEQAILALRRNIAKPVENKVKLEHITKGNCPKCNAPVKHTEDINFCGLCGQRLKWF